MEFILKEQFLPLSQPKQANIQYYQWLEKKRTEKEKTEYEKILKLWDQIDEVEKTNERRKGHRGTKESKCYEEVIVAPAKPEVTYIKNMMWKQTVDSKIERIRQEHNEEKEKEEQRHLAAKPKDKKLFREVQHKGPIKAWQERFQGYLKSKNEQSGDPEFHFRPAINQTSRILTQNMTEKVENRLINYGQRLKEKKAEQEAVYEQQLSQQRNRGYSNNLSVESNRSDIFYRLYKDGEKINKKRNQQRSEYSFTPKINQASIDIASKVTHKRKPLYQSKFTPDNSLRQKSKSQTNRKEVDPGGFSDFLKRNQALLQKRGQNKSRREEQMKDRQNRQAKLCTFTPELNRNSLKIIANRPSEFIDNTHNAISNSEMSNAEAGKEATLKIAQLFKPQQSSSEQYDGKAGISQLKQPVQRRHRLCSEYNVLPQSKQQVDYDDLHTEVKEEQSIMILGREGQMRSHLNISRGYESYLFATERGEDRSMVIAEEMEEDSIEKEKDELWENDLMMMESQIEAMMKRSTH